MNETIVNFLRGNLGIIQITGALLGKKTKLGVTFWEKQKKRIFLEKSSFFFFTICLSLIQIKLENLCYAVVVEPHQFIVGVDLET